MKNSLLYLIILILFVGFTSCIDENQDQYLQGNEIRLVSEIIPSSRVANNSLQSTQIVEGQQLGVTITGAQTEHTNAIWVADEKGVLKPEGEKVVWGDEDAVVVAYHPYCSEWTGNNHSFTISTDQSTEDEYLSSDLLWATATAPPSSHPVTLKFIHKLTKINVTIVSDEIDDLNGTIVYITGTKISADLNLATGLLSDAIGHPFPIKAGNITESSPMVSAILVPQTVTAGTKLIKIVHAGIEYNYSLPKDMEYKSGTSYNYVLKVVGEGSPALIEVVSNGIDDMEIKEW